MKYLLVLGLSLCFASATVSAASPLLSKADFRFDSEGHVVNIDKNGAELYLYYMGALRDTGENIRITIDDPSLKITYGKRCNIKTSPDTCKFVLAYANMKLPTYGKKTVTVLNESQEKIAEYVIWVKPSKDEQEMHWMSKGYKGYPINGPVIMQNGTHVTRTYSVHIGNERDSGRYSTPDKFLHPLAFILPAKSLCYIDRRLYNLDINDKDIDKFYITPSDSMSGLIGDYLVDETSKEDKSYNGFSIKDLTLNWISTCATEAMPECAEKEKWASWTVGLMNLSGKVLQDPRKKLKSGEMIYLDNRSWDSRDSIYWNNEWNIERVALFAIQGTTDGSSFDPSKISPSLQEVQTAPPCSKYTDQPMPARETLVIRIKGPGALVNENGVVFRNTLSAPTVDNGVLVEFTAVPDEGHRFTGWSGVNCNNDSLYCAVNVDGYTDITASFE